MPDSGEKGDKFRLVSRRVPNVHFGTTKRDDILKEANFLNSSVPYSYAPNAKFVDKVINDFDSRFKKPSRVPISTTDRDSARRLYTPLGSSTHVSQTKDVNYMPPDYDEKLKKRVKQACMGTEKREAILKQANPLKVTLCAPACMYAYLSYSLYIQM